MFFTSFAETYIHFFIQYVFYFSPFVSGISINNATIPTSPITTPRIIFPNTMHRLIPIPRRSAPKIANTTVPTVLPFNLMWKTGWKNGDIIKKNTGRCLYLPVLKMKHWLFLYERDYRTDLYRVTKCCKACNFVIFKIDRFIEYYKK